MVAARCRPGIRSDEGRHLGPVGPVRPDGSGRRCLRPPAGGPGRPPPCRGGPRAVKFEPPRADGNGMECRQAIEAEPSTDPVRCCRRPRGRCRREAGAGVGADRIALGTALQARADEVGELVDRRFAKDCTGRRSPPARLATFLISRWIATGEAASAEDKAVLTRAGRTGHTRERIPGQRGQGLSGLAGQHHRRPQRGGPPAAGRRRGTGFGL